MSEQERSFEPAGPSSEDDLLSPEGEAPPEDEESRPEAAAEAARIRDPRRSFVRIGWAFVAVAAVFGALMFAELIRISNALNNTQCIQRAQADYLQAVGPGVTAQYAALDRLAGNYQLAKCGH